MFKLFHDSSLYLIFITQHLLVNAEFVMRNAELLQDELHCELLTLNLGNTVSQIRLHEISETASRKFGIAGNSS